MSTGDFQRKAVQRLNLCFEMYELGTEMMKQKLRREHPEASTGELHDRFTAWLHDRPGAPYGDGVGRPTRRLRGG